MTFIALGFAGGVAMVWLYAAMRARLGPGPGTAALAGGIVWFLGYFYSGMAMYAMGMYPSRLMAISLVWGLSSRSLLRWPAARCILRPRLGLPMNRSLHSLVLLTAIVLGTALSAARAPLGERDNLIEILAGLAERTQQDDDRFTSIICTEAVHQQDLTFNLDEVGRPRHTVYELSVTRDPKSKDGNDFRVERALLSVNGRPAKKIRNRAAPTRRPARPSRSNFCSRSTRGSSGLP